MRKVLSGLIALILATTVQLSPAEHPSTVGVMFPDTGAYDSTSYRDLVRKVQIALEKEGYYVGGHTGSFGFETRAAVRRYRRDHGLAIMGKIDGELLRSLGFR